MNKKTKKNDKKKINKTEIESENIKIKIKAN